MPEVRQLSHTWGFCGDFFFGCAGSQFFSCSTWIYSLIRAWRSLTLSFQVPELFSTNFSNNGVFCLNFPVLPALGATACFLFADEKQRVAIVLESQVTCPSTCSLWLVGHTLEQKPWYAEKVCCFPFTFYWKTCSGRRQCRLQGLGTLTRAQASNAYDFWNQPPLAVTSSHTSPIWPVIS